MEKNYYLQKFHEYAPAILRISVSLVFLWFGFTQLFHPSSWVSYLPQWTGKFIISQTTIVILNALFEIFFGILLLIGFYTRLSALLLGVHLLGITLSIGLNATGIRDFGLTFATLAIFLYGPDKLTLDYKSGSFRPYQQDIEIGKHHPYLRILIPFVIIILILNTGFIIYEEGRIKDILEKLKELDLTSANKITGTQQKITLTPEVVAQHNSENDCWLIINNKVYDVTDYIPSHPGGKNEILPFCGKEATQAFQTKGSKGENHTDFAYSLLNSFYIGDIGQEIGQDTKTPEENQTPTQPIKETKNETILENKTINQPTGIILTMEEIAKHNNQGSCWLIILGKVYDVTMYLNVHPGGIAVILPYCGKEATAAFQTKGDKGKDHSANAYQLLKAYYIGDLGGISTSIPGNNTGTGNQTGTAPATPIIPQPKGSFCDIQVVLLRLYPNGTIKEIKYKTDTEQYDTRVISNGTRIRVKLDSLANVIKIEQEVSEMPFISNITVCDIENLILNNYPGAVMLEIKWKTDIRIWDGRMYYQNILYKFKYAPNGELISIEIV